MFNRILPIIKISRPLNILIVFMTVTVAGFICSKNDDINMSLLLAAVSASFIAAAGYIINDYYDVKIDKINRPDRPLVSGSLSGRAAIIFYFIFSLTGLSLAAIINYIALIITFLTVILLYIYSYKIKSITLLGNLSIAFLTGLTFIYGGAAVNSSQINE